MTDKQIKALATIALYGTDGINLFINIDTWANASTILSLKKKGLITVNRTGSIWYCRIVE